MKITAFFTNAGTPATGLSATIDGWEVSLSQVITAQAMTEQAAGWYYYEFAGYDETKDYIFRCDGSATLSGYDRYTFGTNRDDLEMSGKLPTNNFMGSSVKTDLNGTIDGIDTKTTNLPGDPASETNVNANETKIDTAITDIGNLNDLSTADVNAEVASALDTAIPVTPTSNSINERVKQIDENPNTYKADVSGLATESNATTNTSNIQTNIDANETKIDSVISDTDRLRYRGSVWIDDTAANTNTVIGTDGIQENPVSTLAVALTITTALNIQSLKLMNNTSISLSQSFANWVIEGIGGNNTITLNSQSIDYAEINHCVVTGTQGGTNSTDLHGCYLDTILALSCDAIDSYLTGDFTIKNSNDVLFDHCASAVAGNGTPAMTFTAGATDVCFRHYSGGIELKAMTSDHTMSLETDGQVIINANCTGGTLTIRGNMTITDNSGNVTITQDAALNRSVLALEANATTNTSNIQTNINANETKIDLLQTDSTAIKAKTDNLPTDTQDFLEQQLGLADKNSYLDQLVVDGSDRMTSCRKRIYNSKANAISHGATGLLHTFNITVTYTNGDLESYLVTMD